MTSTAEKDPTREEKVAGGNRDPSNGAVAESSAAEVDIITISTADPNQQNNGGNMPDGSVVSAITDHASIGAPPNLPMYCATGEAASNVPDVAVPAQVILDSESTDIQQNGGIVATEVAPPPPPVSDQQIRSEPPDQAMEVKNAGTDSQSIHSTSAIPDPPPSLEGETVPEQPHSVSGDPITTPQTQPKQHGSSMLMDRESSENLDDYIRSPEVQNAIVERSPGGRYVRFMEKLGSGASKDVFRAYDTQEGIEVAWNVVTLSGVPKTERNRIVNEVRLLERLHHSNIISFHGSWVNRERQEVNFVTEILSSGTLKSFINKVQVIRWKIAKRWATQILKGLEYLHSQDPPVIHRDLKCDNIFINGTSGDLRIGDLGLSTVHRNGRKLSVLGTPEFMAPDMYDDRPYDEKVDIYAFGMCMLEIFTKEIPYSECNNPAQIYKKVYAGEPPEILSRLQSRHAREFVEYCMGYKDENGIYVRPSATELLKHPFLMKRPTDDDEVVVERPLRERAIAETSESNGSSIHRLRRESASVTGSSMKSQQFQHYSPKPNNNSSSTEHPALVSTGRHHRENSLSYDETEGNDHFDDMPESETNMKKVKVLMGRDQVLNEDEDDGPPPTNPSNVATEQATSTSPSIVHPPQEMYVQEPQPFQEHPAGQSEDNNASAVQPRAQFSQEVVSPATAHEGNLPQTEDGSQRHYLVAAAVIEHEGPDVRPYADDILKLVVTLPIEGQTQNVQFEFHLVEDDAVKVAKEMVQELGIPPDAVLEISETISGLACAARMKQDKYSARMKGQEPGSSTPSHPIPTADIHRNSTSVGSVNAAAPEATAAHRTSISLQEPPQYSEENVRNTGFPDSSSNQGNAGRVMQPLSHSLPHRTEHHFVDTTGIPSQQGQYQSGASSSTQGVSQAHYPSVNHDIHDTAPLPHAMNQGHSSYQNTAENPTHVVPQSHYSQVHSSQETASRTYAAPYAQDSSMDQRRTSVQQEGASVQGVPSHLHEGHQGIETQNQPAPMNSADPSGGNWVGGSQGSSYQGVDQAAPPTNFATIPAEPPYTPIPNQTALPPRPPSAPLSGDSVAAAQASLANFSSAINGMSPASRKEELFHLADEMNDELREKLRKLEEDYQKNLKIAKKVFDSRMENLERSQTEKEAQHQKFLEKHEKERVAFEKRRALEEEQQMRRIELLQKEWDKKREMLAQQVNALSASETNAEDKEKIQSAVNASLTTLTAALDQHGQQRAAVINEPSYPHRSSISTAPPNASLPNPDLPQQPP